MAELLVILTPLESTCVDTKMAVWCFVLFCVARSRTRTTTHLYVNRFAVALQCTHTSEPVRAHRRARRTQRGCRVPARRPSRRVLTRQWKRSFCSPEGWERPVLSSSLQYVLRLLPAPALASHASSVVSAMRCSTLFTACLAHMRPGCSSTTFTSATRNTWLPALFRPRPAIRAPAKSFCVR